MQVMVDQLQNLKEMKERAVLRHGKDARSVKDLQRQIDALQYIREMGLNSAHQTFLVMGRTRLEIKKDKS